MMRISLAALIVISVASPILAQPPGGIEVTCDVDRPTFRALIRGQTEVAFRLWDAETGGSQCGAAYVVPVDDLVVFKRYTDRTTTAAAPALARKRAARIAAVLGSDGSPVQLCTGSESWLDVTVGTTTMTCDFSSQVPQGRRRLYAVPFAQTAQSGGVAQIDTGAGLQGGPITNTGTVSISAPTCSGTDKLTWNGSNFLCQTDQSGGGGTVMSIGAGVGLTGGPITTSGSLAVNAPACTGTDKLAWNGSAFTCLPDQNSGGTVTSLATGAGLAGGPITGAGSISVNAPTCVSTEKLTWDGANFQCVPDQVGAGASAVRAFLGADEFATAPALVSFDVKSYDVANEFSTTTSRFTATSTGLYVVHASVRVEDAGCTVHQFSIRKNGAATAIARRGFLSSSNEDNPLMQAFDVLQLEVGEYVEVWLDIAACNTAVRIFPGSTSSFIAIARIG